MTPATKLEGFLNSAQISEREGKPLLSPNKTEEISAITGYANANKLAVEITGAGTKRSWGNAFFPDLLFDTTRLIGVREHSWQDLTATVAAGTPWAAMQSVLAQHNQMVALDPLWPETATVGGIIATNDSGALRLRYGSLRDLVIGMTIVLADGTIARSGGKVVKNVAGYDLHKLMIGAFGTLGIITEVTFRLHPIPQHLQTFAVSAPQAALAGLMHSIHDSHLLAQALQLRGDRTGFHLDIQLSAHPDARQSEILHEMAEAAGCSTSQRDVGSEPADPSPFVARQRFFHGDSVVVKATMLPTSISGAVAQVVRLGGSAVGQSTGILYACFPPQIALDSLPALRQTLRSEAGASIAVLQSPTPPVDAWASPYISGHPLMREIKRQFDPNRTLNPGRFLGGI